MSWYWSVSNCFSFQLVNSSFLFLVASLYRFDAGFFYSYHCSSLNECISCWTHYLQKDSVEDCPEKCSELVGSLYLTLASFIKYKVLCWELVYPFLLSWRRDYHLCTSCRTQCLLPSYANRLFIQEHCLFASPCSALPSLSFVRASEVHYVLPPVSTHLDPIVAKNDLFILPTRFHVCFRELCFLCFVLSV